MSSDPADFDFAGRRSAATVGRWQLSLASFLMLALWVGSEMVA